MSLISECAFEIELSQNKRPSGRGDILCFGVTIKGGDSHRGTADHPSFHREHAGIGMGMEQRCHPEVSRVQPYLPAHG